MTFNFAFWLSLILASAGCTGLILAGKGRWYGWGVGLAVQPVWAMYAIVTKGYGLLLTCLMYGFVNARNLLKWRVDNHKGINWDEPLGYVHNITEDENGLKIEWDIDANLPMYTRDYLRMEKDDGGVR